MGRPDDEAFLDFVAAWGRQMRRTAFLICGDWQRADDIIQEALIRLHGAWPKLRSDQSVPGYARRIVVNVALDTRRASRAEVPVAEVAPTGAVADDAAGVAQRLALHDALARLGPRQRACVVLRYYDDLSVAEVAAILGCREGTVKSQTARGLDALRTVLADLTIAEGAER